MPQLPIYNSKENIQANTAEPLRNEAAQPFQDQQKVISTLGDIGQKWSDANDVMQLTKAKSTAQIAFAQQEALAKNDPNPDNIDAHLKAIQKVTNDSTKDISNQMVSQKASQEINAEAMISSIKINGMFKEKQMLANDINLGNTANLAAQNKSNAVTDAQGQKVESDFLHTVNMNYSAGVISEARAKSLIDDYRIGEVKADLSKEGATTVANSQVEAELNKGVGGKYKDLSADQNTEAKRLVRLQVRDNLQTSVSNTLDSRVDTIKKISSGDLTWQNTNAISKIAMVDPKLGEAMQAVFDRESKGKEYKPQDSQNKDFAKLVNDIFSSKTKDEISNYLVDTLYSSANRNMSRDRMAILVNAAEKRGATLPTLPSSNNGQDSPQQHEVDNAVKHIQNFVHENPKGDSVFASFFKNISDGSAPAQAKDDAIKSYNLQQYPWVGNLPKEGALYRDKASGAKRRIFPDGSFKEEK